MRLYLRLLIDPIELCILVFEDFALFEPEINLFLGIVDAVGTVADIAADVLDYA